MAYFDDNPSQEPGCYGKEQSEHLGGYMLGGDPGSWAPEAWALLLEEKVMKTCAKCGGEVISRVEDFPYRVPGFRVMLAGITVHRCT